MTGWFTTDFTLAELKTLRAKERLPRVRQESTMWDDRFEVPTFDEVLELRERLTRELGERSASTRRPSTRRSSTRPASTSRRRSPTPCAGTTSTVRTRRSSSSRSSCPTSSSCATSTGSGPLVFLVTSGAPYDLVAKGDPRVP